DEQQRGSQEILRSIQTVDRAASESRETAANLARTVQELVEQEETLTSVVAFFRHTGDDTLVEEGDDSTATDA
ncbi:MAG: hypothetical protein D6761_13925, partial [Candidatus Dadabacteria bacterium]